MWYMATKHLSGPNVTGVIWVSGFGRRCRQGFAQAVQLFLHDKTARRVCEIAWAGGHDLSFNVPTTFPAPMWEEVPNAERDRSKPGPLFIIEEQASPPVFVRAGSPVAPVETPRWESILRARERQKERQGSVTNGQMTPKQITTLLYLSREARRLLYRADARFSLGFEGYYGVIRVACTAADLDSSPRIEEEHVAEALHTQRPMLCSLLPGRRSTGGTSPRQ